MSYEPKYLDMEMLADSLKGQISFGASQHLGGQVINPDRVLHYVKQVEDELDLILRQIYVLPLVNQHPILGAIVEDKVRRLLLMHIPAAYSGAGSAEPPVSAGRAENLLMMLTAGHNISIPGLPPQQNIPGVMTPQPFVLEGEALQSSQPDTLTRNVTITSKRFYTEKDIGGVDFRFGERPNQIFGYERRVF